MKTIHTIRSIRAPMDSVFATISDVRIFAKAVPHIDKIEFLTDQRSGEGTRFRETREMHGKLQTVELEVKEYVQNDRVRMVSDAGGTIWDTLFTVQSQGDAVKMEMVMEARPHKLLAKIFTPMIMGMVAKAVEADMDAVQQYCEQS